MFFYLYRASISWVNQQGTIKIKLQNNEAWEKKHDKNKFIQNGSCLHQFLAQEIEKIITLQKETKLNLCPPSMKSSP